MVTVVIKGYRVMLLPNNKQRTKLFETANCARYAYNWTVAEQMKHLEETGEYYADGVLRKKFTEHKKENPWLYGISNNATKQAVKDATQAFWDFVSEKKKPGYKPFSKKKIARSKRLGFELKRYDMSHHPKYKKKGKSKVSFYADTDKIDFTDTHVQLEKIADGCKKNRAKANWVRLAETGRIPVGKKYINPRVTYDGENWWVSVGVEQESIESIPTNKGLGVDVGVKDLAVCSDTAVYENINKTKEVRRLEKKKRRLQRSVSRKYEKNKKEERYCKTSNIIKSEAKLLRIHHRLSGVRLDHVHQATTKIINQKPRFVAVEDLNVRGMMSNKHLSKVIQNQELAEFSRQIQYKAAWNNVSTVLADRYFPSSKMCIMCGYIKKDLKLRDRTYVCPECGNVIDRDYQAALNLYEYGRQMVA
jgi:putative transposase